MERADDVDSADDADEERLERMFAEVRHLAHEAGPLALDGAYVRAVEVVDSLPQNQSGADKTWVFNALRQFREYYGSAVRVR